MSDYEVGYGKPPKHSRFKKGVSPNPKGRRKRKPLPAGTIIDNAMNAVAEFREQGQIKKATRQELTLRNYVKLALKGSAKAADMLLQLRAHAARFGDAETNRFEITDWLPDYPGQTGEQKTREFAERGVAQTSEWWKRSEPGAADKDP